MKAWLDPRVESIDENIGDFAVTVVVRTEAGGPKPRSSFVAAPRVQHVVGGVPIDRVGSDSGYAAYTDMDPKFSLPPIAPSDFVAEGSSFVARKEIVVASIRDDELVEGPEVLELERTGAVIWVESNGTTCRSSEYAGTAPVCPRMQVTIIDDDAAPAITTPSRIVAAEGTTEVVTLTATDADNPTRIWTIVGGVDADKFTLVKHRVDRRRVTRLAFKAAKDAGVPDDADGDGNYEVTVQVSDGANPVEAELVVALDGADTFAPSLEWATVDGATLALTWSELLDDASVPSADAFSVSVAGTSRGVNDVSVAGRSVTLTLASAVAVGDATTLSYAPPTGADAAPLQDAAGNDAAALTDWSVANTAPGAVPVISIAGVVTADEGTTEVITLTASDADTPAGNLTWSLVGGVDAGAFVLGDDGVLAFRTAKDFEAPDDADADGDYEITVRVGDGANRAEATLTVRLAYVDAIAPTLRDVAVVGSALTLTYDEALDEQSHPPASAFAVNVGGAARSVSTVSVTGSEVVLTLASAVGADDAVTVSYAVPAAHPVRDAAGNAAAGFPRRTVRTSTKIVSLAITSNPGPDQTYSYGRGSGWRDVIEVTVTFSDSVTVTGTPTLRLDLVSGAGGGDAEVPQSDGSGNGEAAYHAGSGTAVLTFRYPVADGDEDTDGLSIGEDALALDGGTIRNGLNQDVSLAHPGLAPQAGHKVDGVRPKLVGAVAYGRKITLTYGERLRQSSVPNSSYMKVVQPSRLSIRRIAVSGADVHLWLSAPVSPDDRVLIHYVPVGTTNGLRDAAGNVALSHGAFATYEAPDATLSALELSAGTLSPAFSSALESYAVEVGHAVRLVTVTPTVNDPRSTYAFEPAEDADAGAAGHQAALEVGANAITVSVTAADGRTRKDYTVTVTPGACARGDGFLRCAVVHRDGEQTGHTGDGETERGSRTRGGDPVDRLGRGRGRGRGLVGESDGGGVWPRRDHDGNCSIGHRG